jgi:DNA-binding LacI/PurR family transcriptional regulator
MANQKDSNKKMTISEFSRSIGLSAATISSVLNNQHKKRGIAAETVERVKSQAKRLGYRPNIAAKKLRTHSNKLCSFDIAIVTCVEVPIQFTLGLIHAVEKIASMEKYKNYDFSTQIVTFHAGKMSEMTGMLDESRFNGAIITNTMPQDDKYFMDNEISYPVVFLGRYLPKYNCVTVDVNMAGKMAADVLLVNCRCNHPVVLVPNMLTQATSGRLEGFQKECAWRNIECKIIEAKGFLEQDGYNAVMEYLGNGGKFDGLYSIFETLAVGAYHAIKQNGLVIPKDVAVIETGETSICQFMDPPMSSFGLSEVNMYEVAVELLFDQLLGSNDRVVNRILPSIPVLRESTNRTGDILKK